MLPKAIEHSVQEPCYQWDGSQKDPSSHWRIWWTPDHGLASSMSSGFAKTFLQDTEKEWRRGRQRKRWKHNTKKWKGMDFASSTKAAENRTRSELICGAPTTLQGYGKEQKKCYIAVMHPKDHNPRKKNWNTPFRNTPNINLCYHYKL